MQLIFMQKPAKILKRNFFSKMQLVRVAHQRINVTTIILQHVIADVMTLNRLLYFNRCGLSGEYINQFI